jgi:rhodanese-related sulfurtransferase
MTIGPQTPMREVLEAYPGAQRALFRRYHIGGCASCGFQPTETLEQVCHRNNGLNVTEVLDHIRTSHEQDARLFVAPKDLAALCAQQPDLKLLDVRSREEYEAVHIKDSLLLSQPVMQEIMSKWPRSQTLVVIDHQGKTGLDAAAYFLGHGFGNVRCLRGGIDAWSQEVDPELPRYRLGS